MRSGVIAQKVGMTRVFNETGEQVPVTVLKMGSNISSKKANGFVCVLSMALPRHSSISAFPECQ